VTHFLLILLCLTVGGIISRLRILPEGAYKSVNAWVINVALPALSLRYIPEIEWNSQVLLCLSGFFQGVNKVNAMLLVQLRKGRGM